MLVAAVLSLGVAVVGLSAPGAAYADGGAPNLAYIIGGGSSGADLVIMDIAAQRLTGHVAIGGDPGAVVLSADNRYAYVTQAAKNDVAVVDAHAQRVSATLPAGQGPTALAIDPGSGDLFVADTAGNTLTILDPAAGHALATIQVGAHPSGVAMAGPSTGIANPDDAELYVANTDSNSVSVISLVRRKVIAQIPAPGGPLGVVVPAAGGVAYVSTRAGTVLALSVATHQLLGTVFTAAGDTLGAMDYDAATGQIYVPDATAGVVDVLTPASPGGPGTPPTLPKEPARTLALGAGPAAVAITFDGAYGFVTDRATGRVVMFDVAAHHALATIPVGGAPRGVITGAYPPTLNTQQATAAGYIVYAVLGLLVLGGALLFIVGQRRAPTAPGAKDE